MVQKGVVNKKSHVSTISYYIDNKITSQQTVDFGIPFLF